MSEVTTVIDRLRRDVEQIENNHATTHRERGYQIGRIVTAFQGILEEFTTSINQIQRELEAVCETAKMKQIQLFTSLLDLQAAIEYEALRMSTLAQEVPEATDQPLARLRDELVVIDRAEFADSVARRRQKVAHSA